MQEYSALKERNLSDTGYNVHEFWKSYPFEKITLQRTNMVLFIDGHKG